MVGFLKIIKKTRQHYSSASNINVTCIASNSKLNKLKLVFAYGK